MAMESWRVELMRVGILPPTLMGELCGRLARALPCPVAVSDRFVEPAPAYDPARQQYLASGLLEMLLAPCPHGGTKRIGVSHVDLFLPVFTHLFGYALLGGDAGVVSLFRLRPEFSGDEPDPATLMDRLVKEVLHELGHTLGLRHCPVPWCAMNPSRLPEEVDLKDESYCEPCLHAIPGPAHAGRGERTGRATEPGEPGLRSQR